MADSLTNILSIPMLVEKNGTANALDMAFCLYRLAALESKSLESRARPCDIASSLRTRDIVLRRNIFIYDMINMGFTQERIAEKLPIQRCTLVYSYDSILNIREDQAHHKQENIVYEEMQRNINNIYKREFLKEQSNEQ